MLIFVFKGFLQDPEVPGNEFLLKCGVNVAAWMCLVLCDVLVLATNAAQNVSDQV